LEVLLQLRKEFRQFITSGRFFFCQAFLLIFQKKSGITAYMEFIKIYFGRMCKDTQ